MSRSALAALGVSALAAAVAATTLVAAPSSASRTVSEAYTVPSNGVLKLTGHGYGHGHGLSQYGAQGAALKGLTWQRIIAFYYPGTTIGTSAGTIRVLISADTDGDLRVAPASGLRVRLVGSSTSYAVPTTVGATTWRLLHGSTHSSVQYDHGGTWKTWRTLAGDGEFYRSSGDLTLRVPGANRVYGGTLRLIAGHTVDVLPMDEYVKGVVPREMPTSWKPAAVQSQAVAARTYAAFDRAAHKTRSYDTCDTTSCQVYGGRSAQTTAGNAAVVATAGKAVLYRGAPAFTQFSASNGGWLAAGSQPYLVAKADSYDGWSGNSVHTWSTTITRAAVQKQWPSLGTLKRVLVTQRDGHGTWYGRAEKLTLDGSKADVQVSGETFRSRFGLRSTWFHFGA